MLHAADIGIGVTLTDVDLTDERPNLVQFNQTQADRLREPLFKPGVASKLRKRGMTVLKRTYRLQGDKDALVALYRCFNEEPCSYQAGLFLLRMDRDFTLGRLAAVTRKRRLQSA